MRFFVLCAVLLVIAVPMAIAQTPDTTVDFEGFFGWLRPYVMEAVAIVITAAIGWAAKKFHDLTGIQIEAKHREALQSALRNGAKLAIDKLPQGGQLDVRNPAVASGIRYVLESVPDAVAYFDLSPEKIADLLKPKIVAPPIEIVTNPT